MTVNEREALQRVLASRHFARSERLARFLEFTVTAKLASRPQDLKEAVIAAEVYGRDTTYDPNIDSLVRVEAARLRTKLKAYYEDEGRTDDLRIDLPKGGYSPVFIRSLPVKEPKRPLVIRWVLIAVGAACLAAGLWAAQTWQRIAEADNLLMKAWSIMGPGEDFNVIPANGASSGRLHQLTEALRLSQSAVALTPRSLKAHLALANAYYRLGDYDHQMYEGMRAAAGKAAEIDFRSPDAHFYLGYAAFFYLRDFRQAFREWKHCVDLAPDQSEAYRFFTDAAIVTGQFDEAKQRIASGERLMPNSLLLQVSAINLLHHQGDWLGMEQRAADLARRRPDQAVGHRLHGMALTYLRRFVEAEKAFQTANRLAPRHGATQAGLIFLYASSGRHRETLAALADYRTRAGKDAHVPAAIAELLMGNRKAALDELERGFESGDNSLPFIGAHPLLASLRTEPRFQALLARIGLPSASN